MAHTKDDDVLAGVEIRRKMIMRELEDFVSIHNHAGLFGTARRFQRALIELANCAPITPYMRAAGEKCGSRKKP
jgi:hypothetical protein